MRGSCICVQRRCGDHQLIEIGSSLQPLAQPRHTPPPIVSSAAAGLRRHRQPETFDLDFGLPAAIVVGGPATVAATNKCLAQSNKSYPPSNATNKQNAIQRSAHQCGAEEVCDKAAQAGGL